MSKTAAITDAKDADRAITSVEVRDQLVDALKLDLVGPDNDHAFARELLPEPPSRWYLTGFLVPAGAPLERRTDASAQEEIDFGGDSDGTDDASVPEKAAARRGPLPSSMGLTALLPVGVDAITAHVAWGDYCSEGGDEIECTAEDIAPTDSPPEKNENGKTATKQTPKRWRRMPRSESVALTISQTGTRRYDVPESNGLKVMTTVREVSSSITASGRLPQGARSVSVFLVNERDDNKVDPDPTWAFQACLRLESPLPFVARPDLRGDDDGNLANEWDECLADLHYRNVYEYAVGHGVSAFAESDLEGVCHAVATTWMPEGEVERVAPAPIEGVELRMEELGVLADPAEAAARLMPLVVRYREWKTSQELVAIGLSAKRQKTANDLLQDATWAAQRIEDGIKLLEDPQVLEAFRIANRTMARAARQRDAISGKRPAEIKPPEWRPFQLGFLLMTLRSIVQPLHSDRELVDLLFFPTGGGKTEAYLGLAAFTLVLRRLRNEHPHYAGLTVLMRYTLRLLTLDQLGRAAALICALELEREKQPAKLGTWPFEIGLWVGSAATPNRMGCKGYKGPGADYTAYIKTYRFKNDSKKNPLPIPLENCPWCGAKFAPDLFRLVPNDVRPLDLRVHCVNYQCEFCGDRPLPIISVDEAIYRRLPAFIIATVDKFAALPWTGETGALFGQVDRYDANGFYGPCELAKGRPLDGHLPPPDLIIQDELHLISGPLGTIAGVYEATIDHLATRQLDGKAVRPKIIASTATVRKADTQIRALFERQSVAIFPPPGPNLDDSFFAVTEPTTKTPARLYIGVTAPGRSLKVVFLRANLALLSAGLRIYEREGGVLNPNNPADPYMTLLGYFNSLRELGGSRRIVEDEVVSRLERYGKRRRIEPEDDLFVNRKVSYEPVELTSRVSTNQVASAKARLARPYNAKESVDIALATNMISVGLDIVRLGLMVVLGQPKTCAEYIQATSRVGRDPERPGLVVTLLNVHKPRDRSHYERFGAWHASFYRAVEATSVTPFAPRALDRALPAALVAMCRHGNSAMTAAQGAGRILATRNDLRQFSIRMADRAFNHAYPPDPTTTGDIRETVLARSEALIDDWLQIAQEFANKNVGLQYQVEVPGAGQRLLYEPLSAELPNLPRQRQGFKAARSMRDVEHNVDIIVKPLNDWGEQLMAKVQLRLSQVVGAYGPGAMVDLPNDSIIISGLDFWEYDNTNLPIIEEPRLVAILRQILEVPTLTLRTPPPSAEQYSGRQPNITGFRFPEWFFVQRDEKGRGEWRRRRLVHVDSLQNGKFRNRDGKQDSVVPIRFVRACPKGHVGDIDWKAFVHGTKSECTRDLWVEERGTSGDMNDIWIICDCGANRPMSQAARRQLRALGNCNGSRPWLGPGTREACGEPNRLLIRSASNAYFAQELSVISIPDAQSGIDAVVRSAWEDGLSIVDSMEKLLLIKGIPNIAAKLSGYDDTDVLNAIERVRTGGNNMERSIKEVEYTALSEARQELGSDTPEGDFYARSLPKERWAAPWMNSIDRVVLVHRLREVVAQVGFTRFEAAAPDINGDLNLAVQRAPLAVNASWLPAAENRGEGVFITFNSAAIAEWFRRDAVKSRGKELDEGFKAWKNDRPQSSREFPGLPYYMLHSFSHLLLTAIALECGYPVSSLRERIYAGPGQYGVLIYTGSSDAEGTLGGLVASGRSIRRHVRRALELGALCSNDPVCAYHSPKAQDHQELQGSACHGCLLVAETSCEQRNDYLDRALVVPTLDGCGAEFFEGVL